MRQLSTRRSWLLTGLVAACGLAVHPPGAAAQEGGQSGLPPQTLIAFERAELDAFIVDPRDAALKKALSLIPARLTELPGESKGQIPNEAAMLGRLALSTIARPSRFAIVYNPSDMSGGMLGYGMVLSTRYTDKNDADVLHAVVQGIVQQKAERVPGESTAFPGMRETTVPGAGRLLYGPRVGKDGAGYDVIAGTVKDPDQPFAGIPKPTIEGLRPFINGSADFQALTPLLGLLQMGGAGSNKPEIQQAVQKLFEAGLAGPEAMKAHFEIGFTADAMRSRISVQNAGGALKALRLDAGALTPEHFRLIPADATFASVSLVSMQGLADIIAQAQAAQANVGEILSQFKQQTGVDVVQDVVLSLGGVGGMYTSDATGGGGLLSGVAFVSFHDRAKFVAAHDKLVATASKILGQQEFGKYVRLRSWTADGATVYSLNFPGLPVPLEFSYAMTDRWLIAGITPQAVAIAARQASAAGEGLLSNPALSMVKGVQSGGGEMVSLSYADGSRLAREGYGWLTLAGSALANAVRSPSDPTREPGMIVPPYGELMTSVRPAVKIAVRQRKQLVIDSWSDRSVLVSASGVAGAIVNVAPVLAAVGAGAFMVGDHNGFKLNQAIPELPVPAFPPVPEGVRLAAANWLELTTLGFHPVRPRRLAGVDDGLIGADCREP